MHFIKEFNPTQWTISLINPKTESYYFHDLVVYYFRAYILALYLHIFSLDIPRPNLYL